MEDLHADDTEEVVDEEQDDDGRGQSRVEDDGRAEDVAETLLHTKEGQQPEGETQNKIFLKIKENISFWSAQLNNDFFMCCQTE